MSQEEFVFVCKKCGDEIGIKYEQPQQKPVAYVNNMCNDSIEWVKNPFNMEEGTPLYTAPKELSDEEIEEAYRETNEPVSGIGYNMTNGLYAFAREVLKKASEK